jgi:hypothetical protein
MFFLHLQGYESVKILHYQSCFGQTILNELNFTHFMFGNYVADVTLENRLPVRVRLWGYLGEELP